MNTIKLTEREAAALAEVANDEARFNETALNILTEDNSSLMKELRDELIALSNALHSSEPSLKEEWNKGHLIENNGLELWVENESEYKDASDALYTAIIDTLQSMPEFYAYIRKFKPGNAAVHYCECMLWADAFHELIEEQVIASEIRDLEQVKQN